ncbi:transporter, major facilitator family [Babesia divergens]|uniref:Transporter, major facilitator family n=1 Tax=Babesia divergens TaxID=32595 RepID=A0AAD9G6H7_BABDI|nr:transporter, major facilitator family [Babesia divergens]
MVLVFDMSIPEVDGCGLLRSMPDGVDVGVIKPGEESSHSEVLVEEDCKMLAVTHDDNYAESLRKRMRIFVLMSLLECFVNYDIGAMAVMINWIQGPYGFSTTDLGIMGALPYVGLILLSPIIGGIFTFFKARWLIAIGLMFNFLSLVFFALSQNKAMFYISRFLVGATQAFFIIYAPVWVGCFAPERSKNRWMGIIQGSIAVGFIIGYAVTALFHSVGSEGWRYSLITQAGILAVLIYFFCLVPSEYINLPCTSEAKSAAQTLKTSQCAMKDSTSNCGHCEKTSDAMEHVDLPEEIPTRSSLRHIDRHQSIYASRGSCFGRINTDISALPSFSMNACYYDWCRHSNSFILEHPNESPPSDVTLTICKSFCIILKNPYFCFSTVAVSVLFYILTAIQFWTTKVTMAMFDVSPSLIYALFIATSTTAPVTGVFIGSYFIDRLTAKYPRSPLNIDLVIISWAIIALLSGISAVLWQNLYNLVFCVWVILFFGGCMLPPLTLITINTIPQKLQPMASSICMCVYHIFGYIGGTVVPGIVVDITMADNSALYATYLPAALGMVAAFGNAIARYRERKHDPNAI